MTTKAPEALTVGVMSRKLGVPVSRIEYVLRSRDIRPTMRAANARVFDDAALSRVASELRRIAEDRNPGGFL